MTRNGQDMPADGSWRGLYLAGAVAALLAVLFFRRNFAAEMMLSRGFGLLDVPQIMPISAAEWFALLARNPLVGLLLFGLFDLINYALVGLILLALYGALHRANQSVMVVATACGLIGIAVYFASYQGFAMLALSSRHVTAATEAQQALVLAAGEALLAIHNPGALYQGTGIYISLLLVLLAGLLISLVMLRSAVFSRATAVTGLLANLLALSSFVFLAFNPELLWLPHSLAAPFRLAWYILIAIRLFQLARAAPVLDALSAANQGGTP